MKYYKFLKSNGIPMYGTGRWVLPTNGKPAEWMPKIEQLKICFTGYHVTTKKYVVHWLGPKLYEVEVRGDHLDGLHKSCWQQARLIKEIKRWNNKAIYQFLNECLERSAQFLGDKKSCHKRHQQGLIAAEYFNGNPDNITEVEAWLGMRRAISLLADVEEYKDHEGESSWRQKRLVEILGLE